METSILAYARFSLANTHTHTRTHAHTHTRTHAHTHTRTHAHTHTRTHAHTHTRTHAHTHTRTHSHTHAHTHAQTHTRTLSPQNVTRVRHPAESRNNKLNKKSVMNNFREPVAVAAVGRSVFRTIATTRLLPSAERRCLAGLSIATSKW